MNINNITDISHNSCMTVSISVFIALDIIRQLVNVNFAIKVNRKKGL